MPGKRTSMNVIQLVYYNHHIGKSVSNIADMFSLQRQTVYNILNRAKNEQRLELKSSTGRPCKISGRTERLILRKVKENPKISTRELAKEIQEECDVAVSHETIRKTLNKNKYTSRSARKKPLLSAQNVEKRLSFAMMYADKPDDYWSDVIFCDETKIMLYYNDGPNRVWRQPLKALENRNIIPTVKFGKISVMVWGCISSKGVGDLVFIESTMDAQHYLSILRTHLIQSACKFGLMNGNQPMFKFYQDNDPKHKEHTVRTWLLYNCKKVLDTPAQSPDLNPIENVWAYLKKKVAKRHPKNRNDLKSAILEEWNKIPNEYDVPKLLLSMKKRLQAVKNANGGHTKY